MNALNQFKNSIMKVSFIFHYDAGHGWLQVKKSDIKTLGLKDMISCCSYMKGDYVYLEEDCDMSLFVKAYKEFCIDRLQVAEVKLDLEEVNDGDSSIIRTYQMFDGNLIK